MQVIVDNLLTNYQLQGNGKLVLWLHGWGDNLVGSQALQAELAKKYQVLAVDLPGFGKTQPPTGSWSLDDYADFIDTFLGKLQLPQPFAAIGHSNGGAILVRAIAMDRLQPQKLVLVAAAGIRAGKSARRAILQVVAKVGKAATLPLPGRLRQKLRTQLYKSAGSDMLVVESMQETFKKTVRQDVQVDAAKISQPTLLLFGDDDQAVPPYMAQRYKQLIPNAELHMLTTGHFVHLDQPQQTLQLITEFLSV